MKIVVASQNPVKIAAVEAAFKRSFPSEVIHVVGVSVTSGVSDQPMTDQETYQGADNRSSNAAMHSPDADYWVGLEGGVEVKEMEMEAFAWMVVLSKDGRKGKGRTGTFFLPPEVSRLVQSGMELGEADDVVFGTTNSKQANGAVGLLTGDAITRSVYYEAAILLALIPFRNPDLYNL